MKYITYLKNNYHDFFDIDKHGLNATILLCHGCVRAAIENGSTSEHGCFSIKLYLQGSIATQAYFVKP